MNMQGSKGLALMFLLGAFVTGGALGFTADRLMGREYSHPHGRAAAWARMADELQLNPQQRAAMDSLLDKRRQQLRELYRPIRPQLDSLEKTGRQISDSTHAQIRRILTPEQQAKWDEMRNRARAEHDAERRRNGLADTLKK
jgi:Spy/CpxP family protein refolding chaperone